jgi:hypothetical protein
MRLVVGLPVRLGRRDGTLVVISRGGARIRHVLAVKADAELTLTFDSNGDHFAASGNVLSSRVVGLGTGEGGATLFETILRYTHISAEALAIIEQMLGPEPDPAPPAGKPELTT